MTVYDYMTPFEDPETFSPVASLPQSEEMQQSAKSTASPTSKYFDVSAAWYSHPEPFQAQHLTPIPTPSQHEVPELSHQSSTDSSSSKIEAEHPHGTPSDQVPEENDCHICAAIARERKCPNVRCPSTSERRTSTSTKLPTHHHRVQHSFHAPTASQHGSDLELLERSPKRYQHESEPLEEESAPLELESNPLEQESTPLEQAENPSHASYLGDNGDVASRRHARQEAWKRHCRAQRAEQQLRFGTARISSAAMLQVYAEEPEAEVECKTGGQLGQPGTGKMREQYYGKWL